MVNVEFKDQVIRVMENNKAILTVTAERNPDVFGLMLMLDQMGAVDLQVAEETQYKSNIHRYRERKGMTHEQLANAVGCSRQTIVKLETGVSEPKLNLAIKIADVLGMDVRQILN